MSRQKNDPSKYIEFPILDIIAFQLSFILAHLIISGNLDGTYTDFHQMFLLKLMTICQLISIFFFGDYASILKRNPYKEMDNVFGFSVRMGLILLSILFVFQMTKEVSRLQTGWTMLIYIFIDWGFRTANKHRILRNNENGKGKQLSIVAATAGSLADKMISEFKKQHLYNEYQITAILVIDGDTTAIKTSQDIPLLIPGKDAAAYIRQEWVDEILLIQPNGIEFDMEFLSDLTDMGITIHICPLFLHTANIVPSDINKIGNYTVLTSKLRIVPFSQIAIKRLMDITGGLIGCLITLLLMIIIGPLIYIKSPGPIFFSQERIGKNGHRFKMYKFRSMYMDAEEKRASLMGQNRITNGMMFKVDDDPRIIGSEKKDKYGHPCGIGNFIRNTSIDEFPQFWNVLKGDMSLVGTRPPLPDEWDKYGPHHRARMTVKPGITGLWQISGRSDITDFEEVVKLDMEYIRTWNIKTDIKILLKTVQIVFNGKGSCGR